MKALVILKLEQDGLNILKDVMGTLRNTHAHGSSMEKGNGCDLGYVTNKAFSLKVVLVHNVSSHQ